MDNSELIKFLEKNKISKFNESYDYLINMTFKQLTKNNMDKLELKFLNFKSNLLELEKKDNKTLWLEDLNELKKVLHENAQTK